MKYFLLIFLFFISLSDITLSQHNESTVQDIYSLAADKVKTLEAQGEEIVNMTIDLVSSGSTKPIYRFLDPTFEYFVMLIGDKRIDDLKLSICKAGMKEWEQVSSSSGSNPVIRIKPEDVMEYQFMVSVDKWNGDNNAGHFVLILYHKDPARD